MFTYLLITAELAVLYTAFWYLYLREPDRNHRIKGSMWGTYDNAMREGVLDPTLPLVGNCQCGPEYHQHLAPAPVTAGEFTLDQVTNRYVPVVEPKSVLMRMACSIDNTFSQLNVRP